MGLANLVKDAKSHVIHEIAPSLAPSVEGEFQVRLIGCDGQFAEIELRVMDKGQVVHTFGSKTIPVTGTITLEGLRSKINFLPEHLT